MPLQVIAAIFCLIPAQNLALMCTSTVAQRSHKATLADKPEVPLTWGIHAPQSQEHQLHNILPPCGGDVGKCQQQLTTVVLQLLEQLLGASVDLENIRINLKLLWIIPRPEPAGLILHRRPHLPLPDPLSGFPFPQLKPFLSQKENHRCRLSSPEDTR